MSPPVLRLGVQGGVDSEDRAGGEIQKLSHHRGGSEIDRDTPAFLRDKFEFGIIAKNVCLPLREFEFEWGDPADPGATGEPPSILAFGLGETEAVLGGYGQIPGDDAHFASLAAPPAAAGKLNSMGKQDVPQVGILWDQQLAAEG